MVVPQNGLFIMEYPNKMDDFGGTPHFRKPPYIYILRCNVQLSNLALRTEAAYQPFAMLLNVPVFKSSTSNRDTSV